MINASFDRSDPRDTTRGGVSLAPHAKSSMGGARMRNTKARGSVDCLVRTETILMKRLQSRQRTSFNAAEMTVPKILHQMLCTAASDQVMAALGCGEREIVFAGSGGLLYPSYDGPNIEMAPAVKVFYTTGQWCVHTGLRQVYHTRTDERGTARDHEVWSWSLEYGGQNLVGHGGGGTQGGVSQCCCTKSDDTRC